MFHFFALPATRLKVAKAAALSLSISVLSALPAKAMSLAESQGFFSFDNFSISPLSTDSSAQTFTNTFDSGALALANADAQFDLFPRATATNFISNSAFSSAFPSSALAQSEASILGGFAVAAGETFSFDFSGGIDLFTSVEQPTDFATAALGIQYSVLAFDPIDEIFNELDFLALLGEINTPNGADSLSIENSLATALSSVDTIKNTGATQTTESISAQVAGSYSRFFNETTFLTLAEAKVGIAAVEAKEVPTPSLIWGLGVFGANALRKKAAIRERLKKKSTGSDQ